MTTTWACYAHLLPAPIATPCTASGDADRGAEKHTRETNHPTWTSSSAAAMERVMDRG